VHKEEGQFSPDGPNTRGEIEGSQGEKGRKREQGKGGGNRIWGRGRGVDKVAFHRTLKESYTGGKNKRTAINASKTALKERRLGEVPSPYSLKK